MKVSIRIKMIGSFLIILAFASVITFVGVMLMSSKPISEEIKAGEFSHAENLISLRKGTLLSTQEIIEVSANPLYNARILDVIDKKNLDTDVLSRLNRGEKVLVSNTLFLSPATLIKLDDEIIKISVRKQDVFSILRVRIALALLSTVLISFIILALVSSRMLKPILQLTSATQKVAAGDFSVSVDMERNDEIGLLIRNFNKMTKELGSMEYLQRDFIRNVSHEFKTPIASIQGFAKLLQNEDRSPEERREYSNIIMEETDRLSRLSSNILRLSRLEALNELTVKKEFLLDEQIRSAIVLLEPKWSAKGIRFEVTMEKTICTGDEELLQQIWINLIENAIKFSNPGGTVSIDVSFSNLFIETKIKDSGIGMDEETLERIFERFYQGNTSHSGEGSGLGMSIVKRILDLSGGEIEINSSPGQGTTFLVRLPV